MVPAVKYLGYIIDAKGKFSVDKLKAVKNAPTPHNVTELKAYLGLFLPNMATTLAPLYHLLHKMLDGNGPHLKQKLSRHPKSF